DRTNVPPVAARDSPVLGAASPCCTVVTGRPAPWPAVAAVAVGVVPVRPAPLAYSCGRAGPARAPVKMTTYVAPLARVVPRTLTLAVLPIVERAARALCTLPTPVAGALKAMGAVVWPLNVRVKVPPRLVPPSVTVWTSLVPTCVLAVAAGFPSVA